MEEVLEDEEKEDLRGHLLEPGERHMVRAHTEGLSDGVEQPNLTGLMSTLDRD